MADAESDCGDGLDFDALLRTILHGKKCSNAKGKYPVQVDRCERSEQSDGDDLSWPLDRWDTQFEVVVVRSPLVATQRRNVVNFKNPRSETKKGLHTG